MQGSKDVTLSLLHLPASKALLKSITNSTS
jgi:hypothetical protein